MGFLDQIVIMKMNSEHFHYRSKLQLVRGTTCIFSAESQRCFKRLPALIHRSDETGGEGGQDDARNHFQHKTIKPEVQLKNCFLFLFVLKLLN